MPASKRSNTSTPNTTPSKKQPRLSSFFSPSSSKEGKARATFDDFDSGAGGNDEQTDAERRRQEQDDEQLARRLQREWDAPDGQGGSSSSPSAPTTATASTVAVKVEETNGAKEVRSTSSSAIEEQEKKTPSTAPPIPLQRQIPIDLEALDASIEAIELGNDIFVFDAQNIDTMHWPVNAQSGQKTAPYALLSHAFALLSSTRSRLLIVTILTNLLRVLMLHDSDSLLPAVYLVSNHIAPPYDGIELGLGGAIVNRAIRDVTGKTAGHLRVLWNKTGDPGDVAYEAKKDVKTLVGNRKPLEIVKLFQTLHTIAHISGSGSSAAKLSHVTKLLVAARGEENRFLVRTLHSHLRINAVRTTISAAIARAFMLEAPLTHDAAWKVTREERENLLANPTKAKDKVDPRRLELMEKLDRAQRLVREVRARHPNFSSIVPALVEGGLQELSQRVPLRIGTPLSPMLGSITRSLPAMHTKLGSRAFVSEFKYDGQRVQIHAAHYPRSEPGFIETKKMLKGGKGRWVGEQNDVFVRLFSRHLEDMTDKYPDIVDLMPVLMGFQGEAERAEDAGDAPVSKPRSFIIDAEVVALSLEGDPLPFQTLANRSRKDVDLSSIKVRVGVFAFDLMYLDGQGLLKSSFRRRRRLLKEHFPETKPSNPLVARFCHVKSCESTEPDEVERFFAEARESKCEGIMIKSLDHHWELSVPTSGDHEKGTANGHDDGGESDESRLEKLDEIVGEEMQQEDQDRPANGDGSSGVKVEALVGKGVNGRGKALLSTYEPDKRCESWLKVKKDYVEGIGDSLDLVPIGGWHGMGRKAAWWSPVLLAVYDNETGQYQAVCKCISGFTDAEYKSIKFERFAEDGVNAYSGREEPQPRDEYDTGGLIPDVWFVPKEVWEVRGADITLSPVYTASLGLVSQERGLSMRFPRFLKRREDKSVEEASSPRHLANLYFAQNNSNETGASASKTEAGAEAKAVQTHAKEHEVDGASEAEEEEEEEFEASKGIKDFEEE